MSTIAQIALTIIVGVDTHKDKHVAVILDSLGRRLGEMICPTTAPGYEALLSWVKTFGEIEAFGIEGTGSYGAGLCRFLQLNGYAVIEVNRPDRAARRSSGKSDPVDAEAAARAVIAGRATSVPKTTDDKVEMIRLLRVARQGAIKARSQAIITLKAVVVSVPDVLREQLRELSAAKLIDVCAKLRPGIIVDTTAASKMSLRSIASRYRSLDDEIKELSKQLTALTASAAPTLIALKGVGPEVAGTLLQAAGDNPERITSEAAFAALCGVSPVNASSGKTVRHRLNRGGNRQANSALYVVVMTRLRHDESTQKYMTKRMAEGKSKREVTRCLKRYIAREIYRALVADGSHREAEKSNKRVA